MPRSFARVLALLCACLSVLLAVAPAKAANPIPTLPLHVPEIPALAKARALEAEGSWSLAHDAYAAALATLGDPEQRRWCELLRDEAEWRGASESGNWERRAKAAAQRVQSYDALLKAYESPVRVKDEFWFTILAMKLAFLERDLGYHFQNTDTQALYISALDHRGAALPTRDNAMLWLEALRTFHDGEHRWRAGRDNVEAAARLHARLTADLDRASSCAALTRDERAWCRLVHTLRTTGSRETPERDAERWATCLAEGKDSAYAPLARGYHFLHRVNDSGVGIRPSTRDANGAWTRPSVRSLRAELAALRAALAPADEAPLAVELRRALAALDEDWSKPRLSTSIGQPAMPGEPLTLAIGETGQQRITWELRRCEPEAWMKARLLLYDTANALAAVRQEPVLCFGSIAIPSGESLEWGSARVTLLEHTAPGLYAIITHAEQGDKRSDMLHLADCSALGGALQQGTDGKATLWLEHRGTARPLAKAKASLSLVQPGKVEGKKLLPPLVRRAELMTDEQGCAEIPASILDQWSNTQLVAQVDGQHVFIHSGDSWSANRHQDFLVADLFTERELYRPGETVHWRIFMRHRKDGAWALPSAPLDLKITHEGNDEVLLHSAGLHTDETGSLIGELALPPNLKPGRLQLKLLKPADKPRDDGKESDFEILVTELCTVDNFVPPPMTASIELASPVTELRPGCRVKARVRASYFSGGPVQGAEVKLRCTPIPYNISGWGSAKDWSAYQAEMRRFNKTVLTGVTGPDGTVEFALDLPSSMWGITDLHLYAQVTAQAIAPFPAKATWQVSAAGVTQSSIASPAHVCEPGKETPFACTLMDGLGKPYTGAVTVELRERRWRELWLTPEGKPHEGRPAAYVEQVLPEPDHEGRRTWKGWELIDARVTYPAVSTKELQASTEGRLEIPLLLPREGVYQVRILLEGIPLNRTPASENDEEHDTYGRYWRSQPSDTDDLYYAVTRDTQTLPIEPDTVRLVANTPKAREGTLDALLIAPPDRGSTLLTIAGNRAHSTTRVGPRSQVTLLRLPQPRTDGTRITLSTAFLTPTLNPTYGDHTRLELPLPPANTDPVLSVKALGSSPRPGAPLELEIQSTSRDAKPLQASLALSVADDALNALIRNPRNDAANFAGELSPESLNTKVAGQGTQRLEDSDILRDPRTGLGATDDVITLSPFLLRASEEMGYSVNSTLAGSRINTNVTEVSSAITVVTNQYLQDTGATSNGTRLDYTGNTEVSGVAGNFSDKDGGQSLFGPGSARRAPVVRRHFASSALWLPNVRTDQDGKAVVKLTLPDNLTRWKIKARGMALGGNELAYDSTTVEASTPLQARIQAPRFLVEGDSLELISTTVNRTAAPLATQARLSLAGPLTLVKPVSIVASTVQATGETRQTWSLKATAPGAAKMLLDVRSSTEADASEHPIPVLEDGARIPSSASGALARGAHHHAIKLEMPATYDPTRSTATLQLTPSLAGAMIDALPYLVDYPYGCIEQTMSRFLPAVAVRHTLQAQGWKPEQIEARIIARVGAARSQKEGLGALDMVMVDSLTRLADAQNHHGGFGWWPGDNYNDLWMSAYVKWGLVVLHETKPELTDKLAERIEDMNESLDSYLVDELKADTKQPVGRQAWVLAALSRDEALLKVKKAELAAAFDRLYAHKAELNARGRACLSIAAAALADKDRQLVLLRNLMDGCVRSQHEGLGELAQWGIDRAWLSADDNPAECTALTLLALNLLEPGHPLTSAAANWLVLNRRSGNWSSTRDTAFSVLALSRHLAHTGEAAPSVTIEFDVNGVPEGRVALDATTLTDGPVSIPLIQKHLHPGANTVTFRRVAGTSPVYATLLAETWATGEGAKASGHLVQMARSFVEHVPQVRLDGQPVANPRIVAPTALVHAGNVLHATVALRVPQSWEYIMVRIPKAAGCEPLNPLSGRDARLMPLDKGAYERFESGEPSPENMRGWGRTYYREEHDDCSIVFIDELPAGDYVLSIPLSAVHAGDFRVLPATLESMYVPEIRANTAATRLRIGQ